MIEGLGILGIYIGVIVIIAFVRRNIKQNDW